MVASRLSPSAGEPLRRRARTWSRVHERARCARSPARLRPPARLVPTIVHRVSASQVVALDDACASRRPLHGLRQSSIPGHRPPPRDQSSVCGRLPERPRWRAGTRPHSRGESPVATGGWGLQVHPTGCAFGLTLGCTWAGSRQLAPPSNAAARRRLGEGWRSGHTVGSERTSGRMVWPPTASVFARTAGARS